MHYSSTRWANEPSWLIAKQLIESDPLAFYESPRGVGPTAAFTPKTKRPPRPLPPRTGQKPQICYQSGPKHDTGYSNQEWLTHHSSLLPDDCALIVGRVAGRWRNQDSSPGLPAASARFRRVYTRDRTGRRRPRVVFHPIGTLRGLMWRGD